MSEHYRIVYSRNAKEDLKDIYRYIAFQFFAPDTAREQVDRIRTVIRSLSTFPDRHARVEWNPWAGLGVRKVPADRYTVYYLPNQDNHTVTIVRIFYSGRNVEKIISGS